jgi:hypothetical protein
LHRYSGKERGIMILGSRESLANLAFRINDALAADAIVSPVYPGSIASCDATGLESNSEQFEVSFHVDSDPPFRARSWQPAFGSPWAACLALIGLVSVVAGIVHYVF